MLGRKPWYRGLDLDEQEISFERALSDITGIPGEYLRDNSKIHQTSVAERMSWASKRSTTRKEDIAYSLLGIFEINMAMLYGEGEKAFIRLQEETMKNSNDQSLFCWGLHAESEDSSLFARSPADFAGSNNIMQRSGKQGSHQSHYSMTNEGLLWTKPLFRVPDYPGLFLVPLDCSVGNNHDEVLTLLIFRDVYNADVFWREGSIPVLVSTKKFRNATREEFYIKRQSKRSSAIHRIRRPRSGPISRDIKLAEFYPRELIELAQYEEISLLDRSPWDIRKPSPWPRRAHVWVLRFTGVLCNFVVKIFRCEDNRRSPLGPEKTETMANRPF